MGEIVLRETNYDSLLGEFFFTTECPFYTETIVTNGVKIQQRVVRNITAPDLVFDAKDLQELLQRIHLSLDRSSWDDFH